MDQATFLKNLEEIVEAPAGSLKLDSPLDSSSGWTSMAVMAFIAFADENLGGAPKAKAIRECKSVADLMKLSGV